MSESENGHAGVDAVSTSSEETQDTVEEIVGDTAWERFSYSPAVQSAIVKIPSILEKHLDNQTAILRAQMEHHASVTSSATKWILGATVGLALIVVAPTSVLAWNGKLSADAATFLFGAIVGAAFTFLRDFFPRSG